MPDGWRRSGPARRRTSPANLPLGRTRCTCGQLRLDGATDPTPATYASSSRSAPSGRLLVPRSVHAERERSRAAVSRAAGRHLSVRSLCTKQGVLAEDGDARSQHRGPRRSSRIERPAAIHRRRSAATPTPRSTCRARIRARSSAPESLIGRGEPISIKRDLTESSISFNPQQGAGSEPADHLRGRLHRAAGQLPPPPSPDRSLNAFVPGPGTLVLSPGPARSPRPFAAGTAPKPAVPHRQEEGEEEGPVAPGSACRRSSRSS